MFVNELNSLKDLDHPNVIRLIEIYETPDDIILVQELCHGGDLLQRFDSFHEVNEHKIAGIFKQILQAIRYCHNNKIAHRDLKPENFMFISDSDDSRVKLLDFGLATKFEDLIKFDNTNIRGKSSVGTIVFMAPEVINQNYNYKCDLWSAGVILYILV
jgi:calcium-dependent protein kinase